MKNMYWNKEALVDKIVVDARYDKGNIYLNLSDGTSISLVPEGDCCASCYIQHVSGSDALMGKGDGWFATIASVEDIESNPTPEEEAQKFDTLDCWGHRITTNRGICSIEMRCSHNGYYGGWLNINFCNKWSQADLLDDF